ncbi:MAG: ABC transporter permease [Anaerolineaceae bacterium]|nr:ABC transporter permease [Anaerolineaceae bacterium]
MNTFLASFDASLFNSLFRFTTPILLAALGGILCDRVGLFNIALEGMMLTGAFAAIVGDYFSGSALVGVLCGCLAAALLAAIFGFLSVSLKGDVVVLGLATNLLASGLTTFLLKAIFHVQGAFMDPRIVGLDSINLPIIQNIPVLGPIFSGQTILVYLSWLLLILVTIVLFRTPLGLRMRGIGEQPLAAETLGVKVVGLRYLAVVLSGAFCGLAGAQLSVGIVNVFVTDMSAGRGWIAVVAVMLGQSNPLGVLIASVLFGFADSLGFRLQGLGLPSQFTGMLPYIITLLAFLVIRARQKRRRIALTS